jgi:hypothetical protein
MAKKHPLAIRRDALLSEIATLIDMYDLNSFEEVLGTKVAGLASEMQEKYRELGYLLKRLSGMSEQHSREPFSCPPDYVYPCERTGEEMPIEAIFNTATVVIMQAMYVQHRRERAI